MTVTFGCLEDEQSTRIFSTRVGMLNCTGILKLVSNCVSKCNICLENCQWWLIELPCWFKVGSEAEFFDHAIRKR